MKLALTVNEFFLLRLKYSSDSIIADKLNVSRQALQQFRKRNNIPARISHSKTGLTVKVYKDLQIMFNGNDSKIAEKLKCSKQSIYAFRVRNNIPTLHPRKRTNLTVQEYKKLLNIYKSDAAIAKKLRVSRAAIYSFRKYHNLPSIYLAKCNKLKDLVLKYYAAGFPVAKIAELTNHWPCSIYCILKTNKIKKMPLLKGTYYYCSRRNKLFLINKLCKKNPALCTCTNKAKMFKL